MADDYNPDIEQAVDAPRADAAESANSAELGQADRDDAASSPGEPDDPNAEYVEVELGDDDGEASDEAAPKVVSYGDSDESGGESAELDVAALKERAKRADELEAFMQQQEAERAERELASTWKRQEESFDRWCEEYWQKVLEPDLNSRVDREDAERRARKAMEAYRVNWYRTFEASKYDVLQARHQQLGQVLFAQELCKRFGLPQDAQAEILSYPPDLMEREARRIQRQRKEAADLKRAATKAERQDARQQLAQQSVAPGSGRGTTVKLRADSEEYYQAIPWQRVARR